MIPGIISSQMMRARSMYLISRVVARLEDGGTGRESLGFYRSAAWEDDLYVVAFVSVSGNPALTLPAGFTVLDFLAHPDSSGVGLSVIGGFLGELDRVEISWTGAIGAGMVVQIYEDIDPSDPIRSVYVESGDVSSTRDFIIPAIPESVVGCALALGFIGNATHSNLGFSQANIPEIQSINPWGNRTMGAFNYIPDEYGTSSVPPAISTTTTSFSITSAVVLNRKAGTRPAPRPSFAEAVDEIYGGGAGYSWVALKNGAVYDSGYAGYARVADEIPWSLSTESHIASITKAFTSVAILQLRDQSLLDLDDAAYPYISSRFPTITTGGELVTIRQLLQMRSGWNVGLQSNPANVDAEVQAFLNSPLSCPPGRKEFYENGNYAFLQMVIEEVSGKDIRQYFQDHIFTPVGAIVHDAPTSPETLGYSENGSGSGYAVGSRSLLGVGGWYGSITQFSKVFGALRGSTLLRRSSVNELFSQSLGVFPIITDRAAHSRRNGSYTLAGQGIRTDWFRMSDGFDLIVMANSAISARVQLALSLNNTGPLYAYEEITSSGNWDWSAAGEPDSVDVLVVAGGGGSTGGAMANRGGGGGAGGLIWRRGVATSGDVAVIVGGGGDRSNTASVTASNGENSSFGDLEAIGGGAGGSNSGSPPTTGGSGGGSGGSTVSSTVVGADGVIGQGFSGGDGLGDATNSFRRGGGGGGAGGPGDVASSGRGADMRPWLGDQFGDNGFFASGGRGGGIVATAPMGGGGDAFAAGVNADNGQPNTGGGAGGPSGEGAEGGDGGSGVVIIRWVQ